MSTSDFDRREGETPQDYAARLQALGTAGVSDDDLRLYLSRLSAAKAHAYADTRHEAARQALEQQERYELAHPPQPEPGPLEAAQRAIAKLDAADLARLRAWLETLGR